MQKILQIWNNQDSSNSIFYKKLKEFTFKYFCILCFLSLFLLFHFGSLSKYIINQFIIYKLCFNVPLGSNYPSAAQTVDALFLIEPTKLDTIKPRREL